MSLVADIATTEPSATGADHDPITIEIIQSSLRAITDEMFATMRKTAMSSIIYEVLDFGVAFFDGEGNLASSGSGIPAFIGMLQPGVKAILDKFGPDGDKPGDIHDGDVFALNVPHKGGVSHINDVVIIKPVFAGETIIGWLSNKAHWLDLGGAFPGGISPDATEIYQEGLQLPGVKVIEAGRINQGILDIMLANSRVPDITQGDFWAAVASVRAGGRRLEALVDKYGEPAVRFAISDYIQLGRSTALSGLKDLPKGTFTATDTMDDGRELTVAITISDDDFVVDLRGNPPTSPNAFNSTYDATMVDAQMIFKAIVDPQTFANAGTFSVIQLITDEDSMFAAKYPAPVSIYYEVSVLLFDLLWKALAPVVPQRLTAGHYASICGTFIGGTHPETGKPHTIVEPQIGGWGAADGADGISALYTAYHGDTFNVPVEIAEQRNGVMVERLALNDEPGGEGAFIGGKGIVLDYRILADNWWITVAYVRSKYGPWGMDGGLDGSTNYIVVKRAETGEETRYSACTALTLNTGDVVHVVTANGGGFGDPKRRPAAQVHADVKNGYTTHERAADVYGLTAEDLAAAAVATPALAEDPGSDTTHPSAESGKPPSFWAKLFGAEG